ncbi:MAG: hypothetical protein JW940_19055 [Polyangiaceae bacterium]|nr:hypothetical protein [Polyangiaceae bacterium]
MRTPGDSVVVYGSPAREVRVALERQDLFVDIRSRDGSPFNQMRLSLYELVRLEGPPRSFAPSGPGPSRSAPSRLQDRVESAAGLLEQYGHGVLSGDPGFRERIVRQQITGLLENWFTYVGSTYATVDLAIYQIKFEHRQLTKDRRAVLWQLLEQWLDSDDPARASFARTVVSAL